MRRYTCASLTNTVQHIMFVCMEQTPSKVQTSVVLPPSLREQLDAEAARLDRSRSWLTAEAIRQMLARNAAEHDTNV